MRKIVVAAIIAAASVCSPAVLVTSSPAMAANCADPTDPGNRPGGYCSLLRPGTSLSTPVTTGGAAIVCYDSGDAKDYIPRYDGEVVLVAGVEWNCHEEPEYDPCAIG